MKQKAFLSIFAGGEGELKFCNQVTKFSDKSMSNKHNTDLSAVSVIVCLRGGNHFWNNSQNNILKSFMFADQIQNWSEFRDHCLI